MSKVLTHGQVEGLFFTPTMRFRESEFQLYTSILKAFGNKKVRLSRSAYSKLSNLHPSKAYRCLIRLKKMGAIKLRTKANSGTYILPLLTSHDLESISRKKDMLITEKHDKSCPITGSFQKTNQLASKSDKKDVGQDVGKIDYFVRFLKKFGSLFGVEKQTLDIIIYILSNPSTTGSPLPKSPLLFSKLISKEESHTENFRKTLLEYARLRNKMSRIDKSVSRIEKPSAWAHGVISKTNIDQIKKTNAEFEKQIRELKSKRMGILKRLIDKRRGLRNPFQREFSKLSYQEQDVMKEMARNQLQESLKIKTGREYFISCEDALKEVFQNLTFYRERLSYSYCRN